MDEDSEHEKIIECMFDPVTSSILAHLETGEKECSFLADKASVSESEIVDRLAYLVENEYVFKKSLDGRSFFEANSEKLNLIMEDSNNFDNAISGLEKMDSYLN